MGSFKRAWTKYVGLISLILLFPLVHLFYNEDYKVLVYPTDYRLKAWDAKLIITIGKKNVKKCEVTKKETRTRPYIDLDCTRKMKYCKN